MEKISELREAKIISTPDDWFPSLHADGRCNSHWDEDYNPKEMYVEIRLAPWLIKSLDDEPVWHVSAWGAAMIHIYGENLSIL